MIVECECRACKKPLSLEADEQCEPAWLRVFVGMVACNRCADLRQHRLVVTRKIYELCRYLIAIASFSMKDSDRKIKRAHIREALSIQTKEYARWFRKALNGHTEVWSDDFVDLLMDKPDQADTLLKMYRDGARAEVTAQPTHHPL